MRSPDAVELAAGPGGRPVTIRSGPLLLRGDIPTQSLVGHRRTWPEPSWPTAPAMIRILDRCRIRGRGGAGYPFANKVRAAAAAGRTAAVVINGAESEPGSSKDAALLLAFPHLVLDGAELLARALGAREVHVVVPGSRAGVEVAMRWAVAQRPGGIRWLVIPTSGGFVGGHSSAIVEMLAGRRNVPVTRLAPLATGSRRQPATLLSNAETFAQAAAATAAGPAGYLSLGTTDEPGTTLLSIGGDGLLDTGPAEVREVEHGTAVRDVLTTADGALPGPVLVGGYHGTWVPAGSLDSVVVTRTPADGAESILGPGVLLPLPPGRCPVVVTGQILGYLAGQRARQCGPCDKGMPELATAANALAAGGRDAADAARSMVELSQLINGRGACAHPDGAARLTYSMVRAFGDEIAAHERGGCTVRPSGHRARQ